MLEPITHKAENSNAPTEKQNKNEMSNGNGPVGSLLLLFLPSNSCFNWQQNL